MYCTLRLCRRNGSKIWVYDQEHGYGCIETRLFACHVVRNCPDPPEGPVCATLARLSLPWRTIYNNEASAVPGSHAVTLSPKPLSLSILSVLMSAALLLSRTAPCASELTFSQRDLPALRVVSVTGRWDE